MQKPIATRFWKNCERRKGHEHTKTYNEVFRAVFNYQAKYQPFPADDEAWNKAGEELTELSKQGNGNQFLDALLVAVFQEFERAMNRLKQQAGQ